MHDVQYEQCLLNTHAAGLEASMHETLLEMDQHAKIYAQVLNGNMVQAR